MLSETHHFVASTGDAGQRLDHFLVRQFNNTYSRSYLQYLIDQGDVLLNQKKVKRHELVRSSDQVEVVLETKEERPWLIPEKIRLDIVYEDDVILVVNKPSGMVVHPACGHYTGTLVHALLGYCRSLAQVEGPEGFIRPGIVHRLDKETSGLIVVAKTDSAHKSLSDQFASRKIKKKYLAIVRGRIQREEGMINLPVGRHPLHRQKMAVSFGKMKARQAQTHFRVLQRFKQASYVELEPTTGRTHQIRVHLASMGHPILGDTVYGGGLPSQKIPRLALHAASLGFIHPKEGKQVHFQVPLPRDLEAVLKQLA